MLWLAHLGLTLGVAALLRRRWPAPAVLLGALLPDLVDKPLSLVLGWWHGRYVAHSVLFLLLLVAAGLPRWRGRTWARGLAFGSGCHLVLDAMWHVPEALWWPVLGATVPHGPATVGEYVGYLANASMWAFEAAGLGVLGLVAWRRWAQGPAEVTADAVGDA